MLSLVAEDMTKRLDFDRDEITPSEALIYDTFLNLMSEGGLTLTLTSGILRTSKHCGVSRRRVLEIIRKLNPEFSTTHPHYKDFR